MLIFSQCTYYQSASKHGRLTLLYSAMRELTCNGQLWATAAVRQLRSHNVEQWCRIKIFRGGAGVVTPSKPPPPYEQLLSLPTPYFKMFLERSLNDPHTPLQAPFTATPLPIHHPFPPPPLKILIIHMRVSCSNSMANNPGNDCCYSIYIHISPMV